MREFATCRGCGAEIEWALLNGKPHPFNVDPARGGTHEIVERQGEQNTAVYHPKSQRRSGQRLVTSHFASCPKASSFRKS